MPWWCEGIEGMEDRKERRSQDRHLTDPRRAQWEGFVHFGRWDRPSGNQIIPMRDHSTMEDRCKDRSIKGGSCKE